jgi:hypothetical protein
LSTSKIEKLCTETNTSITDLAIGEAEFETEENKVTLRVTDLDGEFATLFVPQGQYG